MIHIKVPRDGRTDIWQNVEEGSKVLTEVDMQEYIYYLSSNNRLSSYISCKGPGDTSFTKKST